MKIWLIEISDFLTEVDGNNRMYRVGMLCNALVASHHQVVWWSSTFNHQRRRQRFDVSTTIDLKDGYRIRLLYGPGYKNSISLRRWMHNRAVAKEFALETTKVPVDDRPELIYSCLPTLEVSEQAVIFGVKHDIPVVVDVRELWPDNYLTAFPRYLRPLVRVALRNEFSRVHRIFHNSTAITASSPAYLAWGLKKANRQASLIDKWFPLGSLVKSGGKNIKDQTSSIYLPNGTVLPQNSLLIVYPGTFSGHLDYETVLKAAHDLYQSGQRHVHFLFVGDGDKAAFLKKLSEGLKNVHLAGWCKKSVIDRILSMSSIGLVPYSIGFEATLPNKPFDYMAAGLPILSSLGGELESIIKHESIGLQYREGNSDDLKRKIMWFLSHPEETKAMGQRAKALFEKKYRADVVYANLVVHLETIAKERMSKL